jgi:hypothetical protein
LSHCTISRFTKDPQLLESRSVKKVRNQLSQYETALCRGEDTTDFHLIKTNFMYESGTVKDRVFLSSFQTRENETLFKKLCNLQIKS